MLDSFSDLQVQDANLLDAFEAHEYSLKNESEVEQDKVWNDIEKLILLYKAKMNEVSGMFRKNKLSLMEQRKKLRSEFAKYDT